MFNVPIETVISYLSDALPTVTDVTPYIDGYIWNYSNPIFDIEKSGIVILVPEQKLISFELSKVMGQGSFAAFAGLQSGKEGNEPL